VASPADHVLGATPANRVSITRNRTGDGGRGCHVQRPNGETIHRGAGEGASVRWPQSPAATQPHVPATPRGRTRGGSVATNRRASSSGTNELVSPSTAAPQVSTKNAVNSGPGHPC
jgi:hypothetical protein